MKAYLPFGDWSGDGHGQYDDILVDINSMDDLLIAQEKIKQQYGETFLKTTQTHMVHLNYQSDVGKH